MAEVMDDNFHETIKVFSKYADEIKEAILNEKISKIVFKDIVFIRVKSKEHQTNADKIRSMSDEELAEYICINAPEACPTGICPGEDFCYKCWLDWLKKEN